MNGLEIEMIEKRIALLIETSTSWGTNLVKGIADYALTHENWYFHLEPRGKYEQLSLPRNWDGEGIIARVTSEDLARQVLKTQKPAVNVSWYSFEKLKIPSCTTDQNKAGRMIAQHFFDRGFRRFAYSGPMNRPHFTDMFGKAFITAVEESGYPCNRFEEEGDLTNPMDWEARKISLGKWIVKLPKPIAMLAFSDTGGRQVAEACRMNEVTIPDQVALMGGEHDELTCQITRPPLSSIDLSPQRIGWEAAAMMARLLAGEAISEPDIRIPPARIITRQSTDALDFTGLLVSQGLSQQFFTTRVVLTPVSRWSSLWTGKKKRVRSKHSRCRMVACRSRTCVQICCERALAFCSASCPSATFVFTISDQAQQTN
jgi:LacI family transcriptional regulator